MKDNFSTQAAEYAQFRPGYPDALIDFLLSHCSHKDAAWDCGTGNGQIAVKLAPHFREVHATDISDRQMKSAQVKSNVHYKVEPAEKTSFSDNQFDLVTVAQAVHWFNFDQFYGEVNRTLKEDGLLAVIGYPLMKINGAMDAVVEKLYSTILGTYWDKERKLVDEHYLTIPFPFEEIQAPPFTIEYDWHFDQLTGFLNTWSAVQHFIRENHLNPVHSMVNELRTAWGTEQTHHVRFPVLLRVGRKKKPDQ